MVSKKKLISGLVSINCLKYKSNEISACEVLLLTTRSLLIRSLISCLFNFKNVSNFKPNCFDFNINLNASFVATPLETFLNFVLPLIN